MPFHEVVIRCGRVLDPANSLDLVADIGIDHGRIAEVGEGLAAEAGGSTIEAGGLWVIPGQIDTHAHVSSAGDDGSVDRALGLAMLAESGTTTCLDLLGAPEALVDGIRRRGAGINTATVLALIPGVTIPGDDPGPATMRDVVADAMRRGAIGVKMIGGYHPFTPESTADVISAANEQAAWVAFHVGTKETGSTLAGLREVPGLLGGGRLHVAHVNAYCRGVIRPADEECREAFEILESVRGQVVTESYLAEMNGTNGLCDEAGNVAADVPRNCLRARGYPTTRDGMRRALLDGYGHAQVVRNERVVLVTGAEAVEVWESAGTNAALSFPVNSPASAFTLATGRHEDGGNFRIDAVSTDGGSIPRNVAIERTMALVRFGALGPLDAVRKLSYNPSRMLGLANKGHFTPGADADVTVIDPERGRATMSLVAGEVIMRDGRSVATGGTWIVTDRGEAAARDSGLPLEVVDLAGSQLYAGWR